MSSVVRVTGRVITFAPIILLASAAEAQQGDPGAQAYIEQARQNLGLRNRADCGKPDKDGAIVVCARRGEDPNRLPLPDERENLAGRTITGEIPNSDKAESMKPAHKCSVVGNGYGCNKGLTVVKQKF